MCFFPCTCGIRYKVVYRPEEEKTTTRCRCGNILTVAGAILELYSRRFGDGDNAWVREEVASKR
jgi:hypothetical protein